MNALCSFCGRSSREVKKIIVPQGPLISASIVLKLVQMFYWRIVNIRRLPT